jgi:hypothetical protein
MFDPIKAKADLKRYFAMTPPAQVVEDFEQANPDIVYEKVRDQLLPKLNIADEEAIINSPTSGVPPAKKD